MRIVAHRVWTVFAGWRNWVFLELETDTGTVGVGEATLEGKEQAVTGAIADLSRIFLGRDPTDIEALWQEMYRNGFWSGGPVMLTAISAIEMACWDITGKRLGEPVYNLLGGRVRARVPVYANGWYFGAQTPEEFAERAREMVARGFRALKWDPFGRAGLVLRSEEAEAAVANVAAVREAVGGDTQLFIEVHGRLSPADAIQMARRLERFNPAWYEEPVPPENLDALAQVARAISIPVATGERLYTKYDYARLLPLCAAAVIQPDVCHAGGILETKKIAAMAEAWYVGVAPHNPNGPVAAAATMQLAANLPNLRILELFIADPPWRDAVATPPLVVEDGMLTVSGRPGLGVTLDHAVLAAHPYEPCDLNFLSVDSVLDRAIYPAATDDLVSRR